MDSLTEVEDDSDTDSVKQELENALYAQIHFEQNTKYFNTSDDNNNNTGYNVNVAGNFLIGYKVKRTTSDILLNRSIGQVDEEVVEDDVSVKQKKHIDDILNRSGADFDDDVDVELQALDSDTDSLYGLLDEAGFDDPGIQLNVTGKKRYRPLLDGKPEEGDTWKVNYSDLRQGRTIGRYHKKFKCHNCNEEGHLSKNCPKPKKAKVCGFCAEPGHFMMSCPQSMCYNCNGPGHDAQNCPSRKRSRYTTCYRCRMTGHEQQYCPDIWRQFHRTIFTGEIRSVKKRKRPPTYCYNCAGDDHLGHECEESRMNVYTQVASPFVCRYDKTLYTCEVDREGSEEPLTKKGKAETEKAKKVSTFVIGKLKANAKTGRNNFDQMQFASPTNKPVKKKNSKAKTNAKSVQVTVQDDNIHYQDNSGSGKNYQSNKSTAKKSFEELFVDGEDFPRNQTPSSSRSQSRPASSKTRGRFQNKHIKFQDEDEIVKPNNSRSQTYETNSNVKPTNAKSQTYASNSNVKPNSSRNQTYATNSNGFRSRFGDVCTISITLNNNQSDRHVSQAETAPNSNETKPKKKQPKESKQTKSERRLAEEEPEPEEFLNHQVHDNEWWKKKKKRRSKKNKGNKNKPTEFTDVLQ